jgi:hypothetical protein
MDERKVTNFLGLTPGSKDKLKICTRGSFHDETISFIKPGPLLSGLADLELFNYLLVDKIQLTRHVQLALLHSVPSR